MKERAWYKHWQVWLIVLLTVLWWPFKVLLNFLSNLLSVFH